MTRPKRIIFSSLLVASVVFLGWQMGLHPARHPHCVPGVPPSVDFVDAASANRYAEISDAAVAACPKGQYDEGAINLDDI